MADKKVKVQVEVDTQPAETKLEGLGAAIRRAKKELRNLPEGSAEWKAKFNEIDDLTDKLKASEAASKDLFDTLESAPGPLGALGKGLNQVKVATQSFGAAFKAIGIGAIVSLIGTLVGAFAKTEGSMKKLEPVIIMFEKLLGGLVEAFQPLIEAFANFALKVLPVFITGIKNLYGGLVSLFTLVKEVGTGVGKILKGIFTLDVKALEEGYNQLQGSWDKTKKTFNEFTDNFEKGYAKQTKTQKENLKKQNEDAQKALDEKIKRLEAENKLDEAQLNKLKEEALALAKTEQEKLDVEKKFAKLSYDAKVKDIEEKQKLYNKDSVEYKTLQAEKINAETEYIKSTTSFAEQQKKLDEDALKSKQDFAEKQRDLEIATIKDATDRAVLERQSKYQKDLADLEADKEFIKKSEEEKNKIRKDLLTASNNDIDKIRTEAKLKQAAIEKGEYDARYARLVAGAANDLQLQRNLLEQKKAADDEYYANALANENLTAEQIRELNEKKLADQIFYTEKSNQIERDRIAVKQKALDDIVSIVGAESEVGRAALVAKQILAAKELIMEVSRTITFSAQAAARSTVAVAEGTAQTAKIGFPQNIPMLIGYAAQAVGIIMAIKSAVSNAKSAAGAAGGAISGMSTSSANITPPTITSAQAPQIQTQGGQNPSTQIAETISRAQAPLRAYVVSQDISSQQALDRRTNRAATFVGG